MKKVKRKIIFLLAGILLFTSTIPVAAINKKCGKSKDTVYEKSSIEYSENTDTFVLDVCGKGEVDVFLGAENKTVKLQTGKNTLHIPKNTYVRVTCSSQEPYVCINSTNKEGIILEDPSYYSAEGFIRDFTACGIDKNINICFGGENLPIQYPLMTYGDESDPQVGDVFSGTAKVEYVQKNATGGTVLGVKLQIASGILQELGTVWTVCADHGAAAPYKNQEFNYTFTITDITDEQIAGSFYARARVGSATDQSMQRPSGKGYQRISAKISIPQWKLWIRKKSYANGQPLEGASFNLWAWDGSSYSKWIGSSMDYGDGWYYFSNIRRTMAVDGYFVVTEEKAPAGYSTNYHKYNSNDEYDYNDDKKCGRQFCLDTDGTWHCYTLEASGYPNPEQGFEYLDDSTQVNLTIEKVDATDTSIKLSGANFELWAWKNGKYGEKVGDFIDHGDGTYSISFPFDKADKSYSGYYYTVWETKAPEGYRIDPSEMGENGKEIYYDFAGNFMSDPSVLTIKNTPDDGNLKLHKESSKPDLTSGMPCYSLAGAVYTVYSDSGCAESVGNLITDESGNSNSLKLKSGTYYVKETKAPDGFLIDEEVYTVYLDTKEVVLQVQDKPYMNPVSVLLKKVDADMGQEAAQNTRTMKGAQFTVKYYPTTDAAEDPAARKEKPVRTWVFQTDKDGYIKWDATYLVSGDELYTCDSGKPCLPVGTITIQETKAPEGYHRNPEIFVIPIKYGETSGTIVSYAAPKIPERLLKAILKKVQTGTDIGISGAVFQHIRPNGRIETLTTDEKGQLVIAGLEYGSHTMKEQSAPDGYYINQNEIKFTVQKDNQIVIDSKAVVTDQDGNIQLMVTPDGNLDITVEDQVVPFTVKIHKTNEKGKVLPGAEFTLYEDASCQNALLTQSTAEDGAVLFEQLYPEKEYYFKETKAPQGYKLPEENKIHKLWVKAVPAKGSFAFIVDDVVYSAIDTDEKKEVYLEGNPDSYIINMKIQNHTGLLLPETGSIMTLILVISGVCAMVTAFKIADKKETEK